MLCVRDQNYPTFQKKDKINNVFYYLPSDYRMLKDIPVICCAEASTNHAYLHMEYVATTWVNCHQSNVWLISVRIFALHSAQSIIRCTRFRIVFPAAECRHSWQQRCVRWIHCSALHAGMGWCKQISEPIVPWQTFRTPATRTRLAGADRRGRTARQWTRGIAKRRRWLFAFKSIQICLIF